MLLHFLVLKPSSICLTLLALINLLHLHLLTYVTKILFSLIWEVPGLTNQDVENVQTGIIK